MTQINDDGRTWRLLVSRFYRELEPGEKLYLGHWPGMTLVLSDGTSFFPGAGCDRWVDMQMRLRRPNVNIDIAIDVIRQEYGEHPCEDPAKIRQYAQQVASITEDTLRTLRTFPQLCHCDPRVEQELYQALTEMQEMCHDADQRSS